MEIGGIEILKISIEDDIYPENLRKIENPPKQLYLIGNLELLNSKSIAIIGSRNCSNEGAKNAKKFAKELSMQGLTIISGMAKGIDTNAHYGALEVGKTTIAVLGGGFNHIFPKENINLYKQIIEENGLVVSEYEPTTEPKSNQFLERNRIISGLSIGVLVIEAMHRSGTSVTVKIAKKQKKEVFVLPHNINEKNGIGTNKMIRDGATLVTNSKDIINEYEDLEYKEIETNNIEEKIKFKNKDQEKIYNLIKNKSSNINKICQKTNIPINIINENLIILELEGYIQKNKGEYICT